MTRDFACFAHRVRDFKRSTANDSGVLSLATYIQCRGRDGGARRLTGLALTASTAAFPASSSMAAMNARLPWSARELAWAISCSRTLAKWRGDSSTDLLTTIFGESHYALGR